MNPITITLSAILVILIILKVIQEIMERRKNNRYVGEIILHLDLDNSDLEVMGTKYEFRHLEYDPDAHEKEESIGCVSKLGKLITIRS